MTNLTRKQRGFSIIELMVVLLISMVIAVMAIPSISNAIVTIRLREGVQGIAGLLQRTRIEAVRLNKSEAARRATLPGNASAVYLDLNQNGGFDAQEPLVQIANELTPTLTGNPTFPSAALLGRFQADSPLPFNVGFNARGLPCTPASTAAPDPCLVGAITTSQGSSAGYLYYFKMTSIFGTRWAALTITPAGRIRVWVYDGTTWN